MLNRVIGLFTGQSTRTTKYNMPDLTKLAFHSQYPAYKNNNVDEGSFTISGSAGSGVNTISATITLGTAPDLVDVLFQGDSDTAFEGTYGDIDPRPDNGWFKKGAVWVEGDAGFIFPTPWIINYKIVGSTVVISAVYRQTFAATTTLTTETVNYKIVDYSVF